MSFSRAQRLPIGVCLIPAACLAVLIHGYHLGADDAAIYVPAIKQAVDPAFYPFGREFFETQAGWSLAPRLIGGSARLMHLPADGAIFLWHVISIYLLLLAAWSLGRCLFESTPARWGGVLLLAGCLTVPVAGTALVIMDPYVTARSLATPASLFSVAAWFQGRRWMALAWLAAIAAIHPQMSFYAAVFLAVLAAADRHRSGDADALGLLPFGWGFQPAQGPAREALLARSYFFITRWEWYEWIGALAPLGLLWWFSRIRLRGATSAVRQVSRAMVFYAILFTASALILASSPRLETFNRLQPMRAFHLLYSIFFVLLGGLIGEYALGRKLWRWAAFLAPLGIGMWFAQAAAYSSSPHVELPGGAGANPWLQAFYWIRAHTPKDAVFALDPNYFAAPGEDQHGFRAIAERSVLADALKDSGPVALFPQLAEKWKRQVTAQSHLDAFQRTDFDRLRALYPVTWILTQAPGPAFATCPYRNKQLAVCVLPF